MGSTTSLTNHNAGVYHSKCGSNNFLNQINQIDQLQINHDDKPNCYEQDVSTLDLKYKNSIYILKTFWSDHINRLSDNEYSKLTMDFYSNVFNLIPSAKLLFISTNKDMTTQSRIYFGMFEWLMSNINDFNQSDIFLIKLAKLGALHTKIGVTMNDYMKMGVAWHQTMSQHFEREYTLRVRFCFNTLYEIVVNVMLGKNFNSKCESQKDKMQIIINTKINKLENCLNDKESMEYLELFMREKFCSELILFYRDYLKYKLLTCSNEEDQKNKQNKYGQYIKTLYIDDGSEKQINISYRIRGEFYAKLNIQNNIYDDNIYDKIKESVIELIRQSLFPLFKTEIKKLCQTNSSLIIKDQMVKSKMCRN